MLYVIYLIRDFLEMRDCLKPGEYSTLKGSCVSMPPREQWGKASNNWSPWPELQVELETRDAAQAHDGNPQLESLT